jgi:hypothetical protein
MDRIEDYLRRAEAAEISAQHALGPDICRQFLEIAEAWRDLAREAGGLAPGEFSRPRRPD